MKINDLESLQSEKLRLKAQAHAYNKQLKEDIDTLKEYYTPKRILLRTGMAALPQIVSTLSTLRSPLNLLKNTFFSMSGAEHKTDHAKKDEAQKGDSGEKTKSGSPIKQIALGLAETVGTLLLSRYLRKKL